MFCSKCGNQMADDAVICTACGCAVNGGTVAKNDDQPSFGFSVLGFFLPLIGLILYLVWHNDYPLKAKSVGKGALIGFIVSVVLSIILVVAIVAFYGFLLSNM